MEYTPTERLARLWQLVREDPACAACQAELDTARAILEAHTDRLSPQEQERYWALPTCIHVFFGRVLELAVGEMRFPEEGTQTL